MDIVSLLLGAVLFVAFVPGVVVTLPKHAKYSTILLVHGVLFAVVTHYVMKWYWDESFGNYGGDPCPNGYVPGINQKGEKDCVPVRGATYDPSSKLV